jgi:uncharacterized membrane protein YkvA (DUF1232 family)
MITAALIVVAVYAAFVCALVVAGRRTQARAVARFVPDCLVLIKRLIADARIARAKKIPLVLLAGYLASPIDLVPDFIPIAGQLDDAILLALALRFLTRASGPDLLREHWPGPPESLRAVLFLAGASST